MGMNPGVSRIQRMISGIWMKPEHARMMGIKKLPAEGGRKEGADMSAERNKTN